MVRWLTAGESHGPALVGVIEGLPSFIPVTTEAVQAALARRRLGHGRGSRMKFEKDQVRLVGGVRHGLSQGGPIAIEIGNTEWPKWETVMSPDPVDLGELEGQARSAPLTRPRPGHADLVGMQKYGFDEARPVLERASARETAARVALGCVAESLLAELGIRIVAHTVAIGPIAGDPDDPAPLPRPDDVEALDADPMRCADPELSARMVAEVDDARRAGDTLGGVVEVIAYGLPAGVGSHVHFDRRLDSKLAGALMGIQAIKGVEVGDGFLTARRRGSAAHDEIIATGDGVSRSTNRAGGTEGGMTTGEPLRVRAGMKPIATVPRALATIDTATGEAATAHHQRSDVCAVPAAGVVAQAMVALVLADAVMEKFGGDSVAETRRNMAAYLEAIPEHLRTAAESRPGVTEDELGAVPTPRPAPRLIATPAAASRVVLVGPPAAGKSTIGRILADRLDLPTVDTDAEIVGVHGPIPELFATKGEAAFREIERATVRRALRRLLDAPGVVSLGGGAILNPGTRAQLQHPGITVVLITIDEETVSRRLGNPSRPLLAGDPERALARWRALVEERRPLYERVADLTVATSQDSPGTAVNRLVDQLAKLARDHEYAKYRSREEAADD